MSTEKDTTYNGWKNRETWLVNLWLTNDEGSAEMLREVVEEGEYEYSFQRGDALKEMVEEYFIPELDTNRYGMASDLIGTALANVDWREIIENHADDNE